MQMWVATIKLLFLEKNMRKVPKLHWHREPGHSEQLALSTQRGTRVELLVSRDRTATIL